MSLKQHTSTSMPLPSSCLPSTKSKILSSFRMSLDQPSTLGCVSSLLPCTQIKHIRRIICWCSGLKTSSTLNTCCLPGGYKSCQTQTPLDTKKALFTVLCGCGGTKNLTLSANVASGGCGLCQTYYPRYEECTHHYNMWFLGSCLSF
jgi:hypothetical protein